MSLALRAAAPPIAAAPRLRIRRPPPRTTPPPCPRCGQSPCPLTPNLVIAALNGDAVAAPRPGRA